MESGVLVQRAPLSSTPPPKMKNFRFELTKVLTNEPPPLKIWQQLVENQNSPPPLNVWNKAYGHKKVCLEQNISMLFLRLPHNDLPFSFGALVIAIYDHKDAEKISQNVFNLALIIDSIPQSGDWIERMIFRRIFWTRCGICLKLD